MQVKICMSILLYYFLSVMLIEYIMFPEYLNSQAYTVFCQLHL
jgi:hypothetical protein